MALDLEPDAQPADVDTAGPGRLRVVLLTVIAVALLAIAGASGFLLRGSGPSAAAAPTVTSVDAGFARDMSTHHDQAVSMAVFTETNSTDPAIKLLAFDIETAQQYQIGQMNGWLDSWGLSRQSNVPMMSWMGGMTMSSGSNDGALMPGMATATQMSTLRASSGKALDVLFLQLMLRHHQGGVTMASYAASHAAEPHVRALAQKMVTVQTGEINQMRQLLSQRGASALPPP